MQEFNRSSCFETWFKDSDMDILKTQCKQRTLQFLNELKGYTFE